MVEIKNEKTDVNLTNIILFLYGFSKIGRSTFASRFEKPIFIASDPGWKRVKTKDKKPVNRIDITSWEDYIESIKLLAKKEIQQEFQTVIIDTVDLLFMYCEKYACDRMGVEHPSDKGYSKGWDILKNYFERNIIILTQLPYAIIFISHAQEQEITTRSIKFTKIKSALPDRAKKIIYPLCDAIGYCCLKTFEENGEYKERRVIIFEPSENLETGDGTGRLPGYIPLNYTYFEKYFNKKEG